MISCGSMVVPPDEWKELAEEFGTEAGTLIGFQSLHAVTLGSLDIDISVSEESHDGGSPFAVKL